MNSLPVVKKNDFLASNWTECLKKATEPSCLHFGTVLRQKGSDAEREGDTTKAAVFRFIGELCSMALRSDEIDRPFVEAASWSTGRTMNVDDLSDEHLTALEEMLPEVTEPAIRARFADILWCRRKRHGFAVQATDAYLASASGLRMAGSLWPNYWPLIERASSLALSLGDPLRSKALDYVTATIDAEVATGVPSFLSARLLSLLLRFKDVDAARFASVAEGLATIAEGVRHHNMSEVYWDSAAQWRAKQKDSEAARIAQRRAAESKVQEAQDAASRSHAAAAGILARAIEMYRRIGGEKPRVEVLRRQMLEYQQRSLKELGAVSVPIDVEPLAIQAISTVTGLELKDALLRLAFITESPKVETLRKQVQELAHNFVFMSLVSTAIIDHQGKVVGKRAAIGRPEKEDDDAVSCQMHSEATLSRKIKVAGLIAPARQEIWNRHHPSIGDLEFLVRFNPFVPHGREFTFLRGLHAGLQGDFLVAAHLLVPQIENSTRWLLNQSGTLTSTLDQELLQEDRDLNSLLYEKSAENLFGEDILFDLRGLLIHRFGTNFRNRMAHGLLFDGDCYASPGEYVWWLVLRFLCTAIMQVKAANVRALTEVPEQDFPPSPDEAAPAQTGPESVAVKSAHLAS